MKLEKWLIALAASLGFAGAADAQTIGIGTSQTGSLNHSVGSALGKVISDETGIQVRVVPYGGGQQFLPLIHAKDLEMAVPAATDALFAYQGKSQYEGKPNTGLRAIGAVFPFVIGWYVRKDAPYKMLADLKGKKIAAGFTTNTAQRQVYLSSLAAEGVSESDFEGVQVPHVVRGADDFAQGRIEASLFAIGAGKIAEVNAKIGGLRFLNAPAGPEAVARLKKVVPTAYIDIQQPAPHLAGIIGPTRMIFEDYLVVTGVQLSDDAAYKVAKILYEQQDKLAGIAKTWSGYRKEGLSRDRGVPFHPGAIKLYREKGIWPAKSS